VFQLLQTVRLRRDLPEQGLARGTRGAVVDLLRGDGEAYEIEIADDAGQTTFVGPIPGEALQPDES
jgi:hypothetical protein